VTSKKLSSDPEGAAPAPIAPPADFERSLSELEAIVEQLEQGDLSLDDSLKQFERGVQLTRACQTALKQAEQKVEILLRKTGQRSDRGDDEGDGFETAEFDAGDE
jgi:exodeoxyribonuclease VII small subunit